MAAFALLIYLPEALIRLGRYLLFTPLMVANAAAALDGGYFQAGNAFSPLRHYWSLAVEEQFYLLYPVLFLLVCARQTPQRRLMTLTGIGVISMAICLRGELRHSTNTFYLMPARAWELMAGGLVALCPVYWRGTRFITEAAAGTAMAVLVASFLLFHETTGFPHPYVLIPCAAVCLLLFIGRRQLTSAFGFLSLRPFTFTGKISYSLYLWHAPVLAFVQYYAIRDLSGMQLAAVGLVVYLIAVLSWWLVETPPRTRRILRSDRAFIVAAVSGCVAVAAIGAWFWYGNGLPDRFSRDVQRLTEPDYLPPSAERCMNLPLDRIAAGDLCRLGPEHPGIRKAVLWGDSHALVLLPAFEDLANSRDVQVNFAGRSSCRPLRGEVEGPAASSGDCAAFNMAMLAAIRSIRPDVSILAGFWDQDFAHEESGRASPSSLLRTRAEAWAKTIAAIRDSGSTLCVVLDVPHLRYVMPYALAMARRRGLDPSFIYPSRADTEARYAGFEMPIRSLAAANILNVVDPKELLCAGTTCAIVKDGRSLYRDSNHLSRVGAMQVMESVGRCLPANDLSNR